ncbi:Retrovirus-related Pol polyprotein from transposon TNT 1-94 [Linum grandiflorum]
MSGSCQFFGSSLISWFSKKQSSVALSTAKAEYISARSCSTQILWLKAQLRDYGISLPTVSLLCDNTSTINMTKNPVYHSRTKHISIKHHFIRELVANKEIELLFIETE